MGVFGKKNAAKKDEKKRGKDADAVSELKGKMALGGTMSGRQAARAVRAMREGRG
ncbi:hypothetical protein ACQHIV_05940 [Kribbella sp. GL6]|uniref:hypothetical protein n=1 Tax=Kribbella sp. GL6 TaxID=3419765 RepID=UPI003D0381C8